MATTAVDHTATRHALSEQAAAFLANPAGWPAAMAARALRLRAGHPAYSANNQALIIMQLWARFETEGMSEAAALQAAIGGAADEIAPAYIWRARGFTAHPAAALCIYSRPITIWIDPATGKKCRQETPKAEKRTVFRVERTYRAADVTDEHGQSAAEAYRAPELPEGEAREVYERLAAWITGQGWNITRTHRDTAEAGSTVHAARAITISGALGEWAAVETLAHEIAHALLHCSDDDRPYAGEHRGDMEAEAEAVAYGLLTAYGQADHARGAARYAIEWARTPDRVAIAYDRATNVLDAVAAVAMGEHDVTVKESAKAAKAATKADNKALAAALRGAGLEPRGEAWKRAKAGEPIDEIAADLATA